MVWSAIAYCLSSSRNFGGADGSVVCCWGCPWAETRRDEGNRRVEDFVGRLNCEGVVRWTSEEADTEADTVVIEIGIELIVLAIDGIVCLVSVQFVREKFLWTYVRTGQDWRVRRTLQRLISEIRRSPSQSERIRITVRGSVPSSILSIFTRRRCPHSAPRRALAASSKSALA